MIQCRIRCNAISDLRVNLMIQCRIGCNAISGLRVDLLTQLRIFRFQSTNIGLRCRHICLQPINIRFGSCHTARKVSQGCICGCGLVFQIIDIVFVRSDITCCCEGFELFINICRGIVIFQLFLNLMLYLISYIYLSAEFGIHFLLRATNSLHFYKLSRPDIYKATASNGTSCPQSQECMSSNPPIFSDPEADLV